MTSDANAGHGFNRGKWPHSWVAVEHLDGSVRASYVPTAAPLEQRVSQSRAQGYTGDPCPNCQMFTMRRNGTCNVCDSCGTTTGCS